MANILRSPTQEVVNGMFHDSEQHQCNQNHVEVQVQLNAQLLKKGPLCCILEIILSRLYAMLKVNCFGLFGNCRKRNSADYIKSVNIGCRLNLKSIVK